MYQILSGGLLKRGSEKVIISTEKNNKNESTTEITETEPFQNAQRFYSSDEEFTGGRPGGSIIGVDSALSRGSRVGDGGNAGSSSSIKSMQEKFYNRTMGETREQRCEYLAKRLFGIVQESKRSSRYMSGVFFCGQYGRDDDVIETIRYKGRNSLFKWCVQHGKHYHVVHDCQFSNGSCRCFQQYKFRRSSRKTVLVKNISLESFRAIVQYHFAEGRSTKILDVGGKNYSRLFNRYEDISNGQCASSSSEYEGHVEACFSEDEALWPEQFSTEQLSSDSEKFGGNSNSRSGSKMYRKRRRRDAGEEKETAQEVLEELIFKICKVPLHDFVTTESFLNSKWRFSNPMSVMFKNAITTTKLKFLNMRLRDYRAFYENMAEMPYWDTSTREEFETKYLHIKFSKSITMKLLIYQCHPNSLDSKFNVINNDWKPSVYNYIKDLLLLLDKKRNKENTDVYLSAPNAGKTLFFDMVRDYFVNCGQMSNWNRNSNFPLQTCGYTRVIFWNEPNYEHAVERNLLKLLGGDSYNAAQKNQMDVNISKTPFIVTANNMPFPNKPEFQYRMKIYHWNSASFLKETNGKKLHPFTFQYLINSCENYFEDDITGYMEKYSNKENNFNSLIKKLHVYSDSEVSDNDDDAILSDNIDTAVTQLTEMEDIDTE